MSRSLPSTGVSASACHVPKIIKQRCLKERWGRGEGDLPMVWIFSLSLKARTMKEIEGEELVYI
jgi:hypothetical protein